MESPESYFKSRIVCDEIVTSDEVDNEPVSPDSTSPSPSSPHAELATCDVDLISKAPSSATQEENGGTSAELPYNYTRLWGLGTLNVFADWMIMKILRLLAAEDLVQLSLVSRAFYIYSDENDLWKDLCIRKHAGDFRCPVPFYGHFHYFSLFFNPLLIHLSSTGTRVRGGVRRCCRRRRTSRRPTRKFPSLASTRTTSTPSGPSLSCVLWCHTSLGLTCHAILSCVRCVVCVCGISCVVL